MRTLGIVAHSVDGAALSFLTACREGAVRLGPHMHPPIILSAVPMGLSLAAWESNDYETVARFLSQGVKQVTEAGADFYVCPDNTAHIVLDQIASQLPIPGLHIANTVCHEITRNGWNRIGLLGTTWTMHGPVYKNALLSKGLECLIPDECMIEQLNTAIFDRLCRGVFDEETTSLFLKAIRELKSNGAECVILGCTEIPLIISAANSPLPVLDSTRLQARQAVRTALSERPLDCKVGWLEVSSEG